MSQHSSTVSRSFGLLVLRLGVGGFLLTHGWGKLQMLRAGNADAFADPIGLGADVSLVLVVIAEFGCAILMMLGFATRLAALVAATSMAVAVATVHAADPWLMDRAAELFRAGDAQSWSSKEPALLYLIPFAALVFTGPGLFSFDRLIWKGWRKHRDRDKSTSVSGSTSGDAHTRAA